MALPIDPQPTPTVSTVVSKLSAPASNNIAITPIIPTDPLFPPHLRPQRPYHLIHPFEGQIPDLPSIRHGQLEGGHAQLSPPPEGVCQTETVDSAKLSCQGSSLAPPYQ